MEPKLENGVWVCPVCGEKFMSKRVAQMHIDRNHPQEARSDPSKNGQSLNEKPGVNEKNRPKNDRAGKTKEKGEEGKKSNKKGPKYKKFKVGDHVAIVIDPSVHIGMPFNRFHGRIGNITGVRGTSYLVGIKDGSKTKTIITHPVHLKKVK